MNQLVVKEITDFIFTEHMQEKADVIFIPGNRYPDMAIKAAKLYGEGRAKYLIPSGKYSVVDGYFKGAIGDKKEYKGKFETEAKFLEWVLLKHGVPKEAILKEQEATYTYQNALFSKAILDERKIAVKSAYICCKSVHAKRCLLYYQWVFKDIKFSVVPVDVEGITKENWHQSKKGIDEVFNEYERIGQQFRNMIKESPLN